MNKSAHRDQLTDFVAEMRRALDANVSPSAQVSFCSHFRPLRVVSGYDFLKLSRIIDFFWIMEYHNPTDSTGEVTAPASLVQSIDQYASLGVSAAKLVVGFPWQGWDLPCTCNSSVGTTCSVPPLPPSVRNLFQFIRPVPYSWALRRFEAGHACEMKHDANASMAYFDYFETNTSTNASIGCRRQVWFNTPATYAAKYRLMLQHNARGIGFYTVDQVDYTRPADVSGMWGALPPVKSDD